MRGDDLALRLGQRCQLRAGPLVQRLQLFHISLGVALVGGRAGRVRLAERCRDVAHVGDDVQGVLPGVGVGIVMVLVVMMALFGGHLPRLDALRSGHGEAFVAGGFGQLLGPGLKAQAVDDQHFGLQQVFGVSGFGFKHMGVFVGAHQRGHRDAVAAHGLHQVAQNAEAGGDRQFVGCCRAGRQQAVRRQNQRRPELT